MSKRVGAERNRAFRQPTDGHGRVFRAHKRIGWNESLGLSIQQAVQIRASPCIVDRLRHAQRFRQRIVNGVCPHQPADNARLNQFVRLGVGGDFVGGVLEFQILVELIVHHDDRLAVGDLVGGFLQEQRTQLAVLLPDRPRDGLCRPHALRGISRRILQQFGIVVSGFGTQPRHGAAANQGHQDRGHDHALLVVPRRAFAHPIGFFDLGL